MIPSESNAAGLLLISTDAAFASALARACSIESGPAVTSPVPPSLAVESARSAPETSILLDLDSLEPGEALRLIAKLSLIASAPILLTGATAVAASPAMDPFMQAGASAVLLKPQGRASISLAGIAAHSFVSELRSALIFAKSLKSHEHA